MTGRDLIVYILQNGLEDKPVFEDGRLLGFMTEIEAAICFDVGCATVQVWADNGYLDSIRIGNTLYIPANSDNPCKKGVEQNHA